MKVEVLAYGALTLLALAAVAQAAELLHRNRTVEKLPEGPLRPRNRDRAANAIGAAIPPDAIGGTARLGATGTTGPLAATETLRTTAAAAAPGLHLRASEAGAPAVGSALPGIDAVDDGVDRSTRPQRRAERPAEVS